MSLRRPLAPRLPPLVGAMLCLVALGGVGTANAADDAQPYWCPEREGAKLQIGPGPGCELLVPPAGEDDEQPLPDVSAEELQATAQAFKQRYHEYLACCAGDPSSEDELKALELEASAILKSMSSLPPVVLMARFRGVMVAVAEARGQLQSLQKRQKDIANRERRMQALGYEVQGRERLAIEAEKQEILNEVRPSDDSQSDLNPTSGPSIGNSSLNNQ